MYTAVEGPFAETYQNNRWNTNGTYSGLDRGPRRSAPAELPFRTQHNGVWRQGGQRLRDYKPTMCFVRPRDGKRAGAAGRIRDGLTGEGPDVFVVKCGDKRTLMRDRPQRWQWSGWQLTRSQQDDLRVYDKDFRRKDLQPVIDWKSSNAWRRAWKSQYNFQSRKYESMAQMQRNPAAFLWTDARWNEGAKRRDAFPLSFRDGGGNWYSRVPADSGDYAGGRPRS